MSETVITVQGTASEWFDAERATAHVQVQFDGPERQPVFDAAVARAEEVAEALRALDGSAVTRWSSDRVNVWSQRPWNEQGAQLPPVYYASVSIEARFQDFEALAGFVERFATVAGIAIGGISWDLTEERRRAVTTDIQARAVRDAAERAAVYATAAGLGAVTPVAIADPGMLGDAGSGGGGGYPMAMARAGKAMMDAESGGAQLTFTPDRIEVSATVDARFRAR